MRAAWLDTSFILGEVFGDRPARRRHRLGDFDSVFASRFLEAEYCNALALAPDPGELTFLTFDARQGRVARKLGFHA